jgi:uncharacterized protein (TIGR03086 family)
MSIETLAAAQLAARNVLGGVSKDQLADSSPCTEWDVAAVIDHMVGSMYWFVTAISEAAPRDEAAQASAGDYRAAFNDAASAVMGAISQDGFATRQVVLPFGTFSGEQFTDFVSLETLAHTWDLAKATSQSTDLAPEASTHLLAVATAMMGSEGRSAEGNFGAVQTCAPDAPAADHLAAFLGRNVQ